MIQSMNDGVLTPGVWEALAAHHSALDSIVPSAPGTAAGVFGEPIVGSPGQAEDAQHRACPSPASEAEGGVITVTPPEREQTGGTESEKFTPEEFIARLKAV